MNGRAPRTQATRLQERPRQTLVQVISQRGQSPALGYLTPCVGWKAAVTHTRSTQSWVNTTVILQTCDRCYKLLGTNRSHLPPVLSCLVIYTGHMKENSTGAVGGPEFLQNFRLSTTPKSLKAGETGAGGFLTFASSP